MGKKSGVALQVLKEQSKALTTHYYDHSLSLSMKDANKELRIFSETMGTAGEIIVLIKFSPKREQILGVINENIEVSSDADNDVFEKLAPLSSYQLVVGQFVLFLSNLFFDFFFYFSFRVWQQFFFVCTSTSNIY